MTIDIAATRKRADAATPGPWEHGTAGWCNVVRFDGMDITGVARVDGATREFVIAARADVPALCDRVEVLEKALRALDPQCITSPPCDSCAGCDARAALEGK